MPNGYRAFYLACGIAIAISCGALLTAFTASPLPFHNPAPWSGP